MAPVTAPINGAINLPLTGIILGIGAVVWLTGHKMQGRQHKDGHRSPAGRVLGLLGLALIVLGLYAGFKGPVKIGGFVLEPFSFAHFVQQSNTEALVYARDHTELSRQPARGWRGGSRTELEYTVKNTGDRAVTTLILRFKADNNATVDLDLRGPFPPRQTVIAIVSVPPNVNRSYFASSAIESDHLVGARF